MKITDNIYWIGIKDWELRSFHGRELSTHHGSTYNSYLLKDEINVLIDTVWDPFADRFIKKLEADPGIANIDAVVINHIEPDHGGSLGILAKNGLRPDVPIYCSKPGAEIINKYFHDVKLNLQPVETGDTIKTGKFKLVFVEMRMIHWPDSMLTYVDGDGTLFSNDAFGQHLCASGYFNDEVDEALLYGEAMKYYAGILTPYSKLIERKIGMLNAMEIPIKLIAPSHGVIWRKDPLDIVNKYLEWSMDYNDGSVVVVYDCLYKATRQIAAAIAQGLENKGVRHKVVNSGDSDFSDLFTDLFRARGMIVGSSTVNNAMLRSISAALDCVKSHKLKGKIGAAFGSYGWSGEAPKQIAEKLESAGVGLIGKPIGIKYAPTADELKECVLFGETFADAL